MRKLNSQFETRFISEPGLNGQNSTYYGFVELDQYYCMVVAEGYDGEGGRESAKLAVDTAIESFVQKPGISKRKIRSYIKSAHKKLIEQSVRVRLKAGILLIVSDYTRFRYGVCGNVMLYGLRESRIYHQSNTHTLYQSMLDENKRLEDERGTAQQTQNLFHYLGGSGTCTVSGKIKLEDQDVLLAATEGFWSRVNKVEILDAFESMKSQEEFLGDLQELYLRGSTDSLPSCCLAALNIKKAYQENVALKKKIRLWCLIIFLILLIGGIILTVVIKSRQKRQKEIRQTVAVYEDTGDQFMIQLNCLLAKQEYEKASEAGKKISKNQVRLEQEQLLSEKINISVVLENADKAYEAQTYTQARTEYKKALDLIKKYPELSPLANIINQKLKMASTGMEIDNYIQNAAFKEAEGDLAAAGALYDQAEAMLRIVDDPVRLQQVQLAKLRVKGQAEQEHKEEQAKARDTVIAEADQAAAMDAVLAGDLEMALELYEKVRAAYVAMEENEKAEQITAIISSLQKQARAAGELHEAIIAQDENDAFQAVLKGDLQTAVELYTKVQEAYTAMEEKEKADEVAATIAALEIQIKEQEGGEMADQDKEPSMSGSEQTQAPKGPGEIPTWSSPEGNEVPVGPGAFHPSSDQVT